MEFGTIYKRDNTGAVRVWRAETKQDGTRAFYRTISGQKNGAQVESEWKEAFPKNTGKANQTNAIQQAESEVSSMYKHRLYRGYMEQIDDIDSFDKVKPMLAASYDDIKEIKFPVYSQPKLDGIRCIARSDGLWTRAGKPIVSCPHIFESLKPLFAKYPTLVLDGELYNHEFRDNFNEIASLVRKTKPTKEDIVNCTQSINYHVYDTVNTTQFFRERLEFLEDVINYQYDCVVVVETNLVENEEQLDSYFQDHYLQFGYEGQMIRLDTLYENKRTKNLIKRKEFITEEFSVVSVEEGKGNWSGYVKRFFVNAPSGVIVGAGVRGTQEQLGALLESGKKPDWATVRFFGYTPDGSLRFPVVVDWGYGKRED